MKLRAHQAQISEIADEVIGGERDPSRKVIVCDVVPGGGKTAMFMLFAAKLLAADAADQVIVIVPRKSLQKQTAKDWAKSSPLNSRGFCLVESRNELPLYVRDGTPLLRATERPVVGLIATNGQLLHMIDEYVELARSKRTILFVDEVHFMGGDDPADAQRWARDIMRLEAACLWTVAASGTLFRSTKADPVALIPYGEPDEKGVRHPLRDVHYTLETAIAESAIKPIYYQRHDADLQYQVGDLERNVTLSEADEGDVGDALSTFLRRKEVWAPVVDRCLDHLKGWREHVYPSRAIVIASKQSHARDIDAHIRKSFPGLRTVLAISDEDDAHARLASFREGEGDVLVTVAMASVGFDVPDCTHMAMLGSTRTVGSLLQTIMRIGRIDYACTVGPALQFGFVWAPKDRWFDDFMAWMRGAMEEGLTEREKRTADSKDERDPRVFIPLGGELGAITYESLDGELPDDDARYYEALCALDPGLAHQPADIVVRIARAAGRVAGGEGLPVSVKPVRVTTPSERLTELRQRCHGLAGRIDYASKLEAGTTERHAAQLFKPVSQRSEAVLEETARWLVARLKEALAAKGR